MRNSRQSHFKMRTLGLAMLTAGLAIAPLTAMSRAPDQSDYMNSANNDSYWVLPAKNYSGNRYVKTNSINPSTVGKLKQAWTFNIKDDDAPMESVPIVWDGTMYITSAHDHVYALDAKTGELKWEFKYNPHVVAFARNRGVAVMGRNVYLGTLDGHLIALDSETGDKVWDKQVVHDPSNSFYTMAPVPYKGKLLLGVSNGDWGGLGYVTAFNPKNGDRIWEWKTVPGPGEPGHDTWSGDSWKRGGAAVWSGLAIDPDTDTMYVSAGNPQPDFLGTVRKGDNLYSDSIVALNIAGSKPKVEWYHQFIPHDTHDWDPAMPPVLFQGTNMGKQQKMVAVGDKGGNFWILNATNGKLLEHTAVSFQKGQNTEPSRMGNIACPNTNGGVEFNGGAYDPNSNTFFVPSSNQCGLWKSNDRAVYIAGQFYLGGSFPKLVGPNTGWFNAIDVGTGTFKWRHRYEQPNNGSAMVTSSGLVFTGDLKGNFNAFDTNTGKMLWQYNTGSPIAAAPSEYTIGGTEYLAVASGPAGFVKDPNTTDQNAGPMVTVFSTKD